LTGGRNSLVVSYTKVMVVYRYSQTGNDILKIVGKIEGCRVG